MKTFKKNTTSHWEEYATGCLLDYNYFKKHKRTAVNLSKQQASIQRIGFIENLDGANNRIMFFIIEEVKETILDCSQWTVKVLWIFLHNLFHVVKVFNRKIFDHTACSTILFCFNIILI